jgi:hypothetical protein
VWYKFTGVNKMNRQETMADLLGNLQELQEEVNYTKEHLVQLKSVCKSFLRKESFRLSRLSCGKKN